MQIAPCRRYGGVSERGLHQVDRRSAIEAVRGVCVSEPVCRDLGLQARPRGGGLHHPVDRAWVERPGLPRQEYGRVGRSFAAQGR